MKFAIEDVFRGISAPDYESLYFDEDFNIALSEALHMGRKLLRLDRTASTIVR